MFSNNLDLVVWISIFIKKYNNAKVHNLLQNGLKYTKSIFIARIFKKFWSVFEVRARAIKSRVFVWNTL